MIRRPRRAGTAGSAVAGGPTVALTAERADPSDGTTVRRQLFTLVAVAMSLVMLAFLIPLGIVLRNSAADRGIAMATDAAQSQAALIAAAPDAAMAFNGDVGTRGLAMSLFLPDGRVLGEAAPRTQSVELAARGNAFKASSGGGVEVLVPVQGGSGDTAVIRAYATPSLLHAGVMRTWGVLGGFGLALLLLGLLLADGLGRRLVGAVTGLAATADRLAGGDLDARAAPDGPRELRRVGAELNRLAARIRELLVAEREEVADLAHRLRTPVTALRLDAEAVKDPEDRGRFAEDVDHLARIVDEVIRTARRPVREGVGAHADLAAVVADRIAFWTPLAEDDGRAIEANVSAGPVLVRGTEADLGAAVDALVQNVFAHTPDGVTMHIEVIARSEGGGVLVVADDGPGFPETDGDATARGESGTSTGLGLDIARRTAEASGGSMRIGRAMRWDAATIPSGGAVVTLTFGPPFARPPLPS